IVTAITVWDQLLLPYGTALTFNPARGRVMNYIIVLGVVAVIFALDHPQLPWKKLLRSRYFLPFIAGNMLFLGLGTRLYAASFLLIFAVYQSNFRCRFRLKALVAWSVPYVLLFGIIGVWRAQDKLAGAWVNVVQESV